MSNVVRDCWAITMTTGTYTSVHPTIYLSKPERKLIPGEELFHFKNVFSAKKYLQAYLSKHLPIKVAA